MKTWTLRRGQTKQSGNERVEVSTFDSIRTCNSQKTCVWPEALTVERGFNWKTENLTNPAPTSIHGCSKPPSTGSQGRARSDHVEGAFYIRVRGSAIAQSSAVVRPGSTPNVNATFPSHLRASYQLVHLIPSALHSLSLWQLTREGLCLFRAWFRGQKILQRSLLACARDLEVTAAFTDVTQKKCPGRFVFAIDCGVAVELEAVS